jgi:uncharacterized protein DUF3592
MKQSLRNSIALAFILAIAVAPAFFPRQTAPLLPRTTAALLFGVICSGLGVFGLVWSGRQIVKGARTRRWCVTRGTITRDGLDEVLDLAAHRGSLRSWYRPVISYTFAVGDTSWTGHRVVVSDTTDDRFTFRQAKVWFDRYPSGTSVNVYFDPLDPSQSVLVPGIPWRNVLGVMGVAAGAIVYAVWWLVAINR